jgi:glucose/arabinose dehydrogenase
VTVTEQETLFQDLGERFRDLRFGPDGALYLLTDNAQGRLLRVVPGGAAAKSD